MIDALNVLCTQLTCDLFAILDGGLHAVSVGNRMNRYQIFGRFGF